MSNDRPRVFEGMDFGEGRDRGAYVVTISPDATMEDVQAFRDAYELGCALAEAEAALPEGWTFSLTRAIRPASEGAAPTYYATASRPWDDGAVEFQVSGPTPAAALRALAAKLRAGS